MRAIVLSAGQGRRLLPLTRECPKCLLPVRGEQSGLEVQLRTLAEAGIRRATVMVGFGADLVENALHQLSIPGLSVDTLHNPFYSLADNLITCWLARDAMTEDFVLLNGDTFFEPKVLTGLLESPSAPLTMVINRKPAYDDDDMKVSLTEAGELQAVSKKLKTENVDGESIGLMLFRGRGVDYFRDALETAARQPEALHAWYLSVINTMAGTLPVQTSCIGDAWWGEVDCEEDLTAVRSVFESIQKAPASSVSDAAAPRAAH
jgi:choline kinase